MSRSSTPRSAVQGAAAVSASKPRKLGADAKPDRFQARRLALLGEPVAKQVVGQLPKPVAKPPEDLVVVGRVGGPFGLDGRLRIEPEAGEDTVLTDVDTWWLRSGIGVTRHVCQELRWQGDALIVTLEGVADRSAAERLVQAEVLVPRSEFPELEEGQLYWMDLMNYRALLPDGSTLGEVVEIFDNGAHGVMDIRADDARSHLVPLVDRHVLAIDDKVRTVTVDWDPSW